MAGTRGEPIEVVLSEAWSWSKFVRKLGSKVLYGLLLMTGLSVLLDQQGIIKSGMGGTEVEPNSLTESIKFADVQGVDEAKHELEEIVAFLKEPKLFMDIGGKLPKGVLLYGPPGTGKTHLARAVAGEAGVPFFQMSGSEFDELYVGVGARRVRELFAAAKKKAPCIVFIDELDAVGSKRSAKDQSYMRQTLNQLLVELDGFSTSEGVIFIAATNTPEALDKALVRPGRFDRLVPVPLPDVQGRANILEVHMKGVTVAPGVDTSVIARGTPGFSGADLANLINQAAIKASKDGAKKVRMQDMEWAKDKIIMGSERKSAVVTEQNKRLTAYHEGGHTLVALYTNGATPLHKVTVIPRGNALGVTVQLPEADKTNHTKRELYAMLDVCMGGRVAEEMVFGPDEVTTGASSDLEKATAVAREMVLVYGMSDKVGVVGYGEEGWDKMSPVTKGIIEAEVKGLLDAAYARATQLLKTHKEELHRLARALMEHETLNVDEVKTVVKGIENIP
ncbi:peptidase family M41-domain-containing protein [Powellomyces hirtus]|nr:peptidase family M41-domain-containing protein [Powellomyces hirtus]